MRWSDFLIKVENGEKILMYNTLNSGIVLFKKDEFDSLEGEFRDNFSGSCKIKSLIEGGFLVDSKENEGHNFMQMLKQELVKDRHFTLHILPTTACNFACPYCYQSGITKNFFLDQFKISKSLSYIDHYLKDRNLKDATLVIHGGEPTVYWEPIIEFLPKIEKIFKKYKIKYRTQIVSNGYNFTPEKSDLLSKYNWQRFQVTLDGLAEIHDKRRVLANGGKTFEKILENIRYILENNRIKKVSVRVNFDKNNVDKIPKLLKYLSENFDKEKITLSLGFISKTVENTGATDYVSLYGITFDTIDEVYLKLYKYAVELGFEMQDLFMFDGMCTAKLDHSMVISADGKIYKCLSGVGRKDFVVSSITAKPFRLPNYLFPELYKKCIKEKCEFLPLCNTGCRFNAYLKNGKIRSRDCQREVLLKINRKILEYLYINSK